MPRQKAKRNFPVEFDATDEEKRFGTPIEIAQYRAERLKCNTILEIGCGVGFQTLEFAKTCKKVIAVDIVKERVERAKDNVKNKNVEFHAIDALDKEFIKALPKIDIIFCDPGRPPSEFERKKSSLSPSLDAIQEAYKNITPDIAYEVPPHLKDLPEDAEKEYLTYFGQLNRLTLYFNKIKQRVLSLIDIPTNIRLEPTIRKPRTKEDPMFIGDINQAVIKAGLVNALAIETKSSIQGKLLLSHHCMESPFVRWYQIIGEGNQVIAKNIALHFPIPEGKYAETKKQFQISKGLKVIHIFRLNRKFILTERR